MTICAMRCRQVFAHRKGIRIDILVVGAVSHLIVSKEAELEMA